MGKELIAALVARSIEVRALARSENAAIAVRGAGAEPVRGDLANHAAMAEGMDECDVVFHAAANVSENGKLADHLRDTVDGTKNALSAAQSAQVKKFVHVGTEAVLADGKPIVRADETVPYPDKPAGPYPLAKGLAERAVIAANTLAFETVSIRPRFIWGRNDTSLLPKLATAVKRGRFGWIGGGHYLTSTCHVVNLVEGALLAAEKGKGGEIYFLTDGEPVDFREFLTTYLATQGVDASKARNIPRWIAATTAALTSWMYEPLVSKTAIALVGGEVTVVDTKARTELGYTGAMTREAGLAEMKVVAS